MEWGDKGLTSGKRGRLPSRSPKKDLPSTREGIKGMGRCGCISPEKNKNG